MKRILILLLVALLVLTTCSTGKVSQGETVNPEKIPAKVETPSTAGLPVDKPSEQPEAQEKQEETEVPSSETQKPQQPEATAEVLPDEGESKSEEPDPIAEAIEAIETIAEEIIEAIEKQDGSEVITADTPAEEHSASAQKPAGTSKPGEQEASKPAQESQPSQPAVQQTQPAVQPASESAPQVAKPVAEPVTEPVAEPATQTPQKPAEKKGSTSKFVAFFSKIGNFVMREKLLSFGLLVCGVGVIYLIVALIISSRPKKPRHHHHDEDSYRDEDDGSVEEEDAADDGHDDVPVQEDVKSGEDDEFLRSLLGEDKR